MVRFRGTSDLACLAKVHRASSCPQDAQCEGRDGNDSLLEGSKWLTACILVLINCSLVLLSLMLRGLPVALPAPSPAARA